MPYFVRATLDDSAQVRSISALVEAYGWREVVVVYEDTDYGRGILPYLTDALQEIDVRVPYHSVIPWAATNETIMQELSVLLAMRTRVFIVHISSTMASLLFTKAKEVGMMNKGFAWITTNGVANIIDSLNPTAIDAMNGVLGVRYHVPRSQELDNLSIRWNRMYQQDNPDESPFNKLSIVGLWGYDTIWALAQAAEKVGISGGRDKKPWSIENSTCLESIPISIKGPELLTAIVRNKFRGLSGDFDLTRRQQLKVSAFQIINVVGRGESTEIPLGWEVPRAGKKLRVGVCSSENPEFIKAYKNLHTNKTTASGLSIDIFEEAVKRLHRPLPYEYVEFDRADTTEDELERFLARFVLCVWMVVLVILASSYTASFASMLTVQQLSPTVTDVHELQKNGECVGFHQGSYIDGLLVEIGFDRSKIKGYATPADFYSALSNGSVAAVVLEVPYIKLFLAKYNKGYTMVGPIYKSAGFAFVLPKNSPLRAEMSTAILNITGGDTIIQIEKKWIYQNKDENGDGSGAINFESCGGLFLITGVVTTGSLFVAMLMSSYKKREQNVGNKRDDKNESGSGPREEKEKMEEQGAQTSNGEGTELMEGQTTLSVPHRSNGNGDQLARQ
ncbi:Glutamate receptor 2.8 [Hordeum vulgare]|nr:Glutamate receptor 2.8 [Hordeum vulgare]